MNGWVTHRVNYGMDQAETDRARHVSIPVPDAGLFVFYYVERAPSGELVAAVSGSLVHLALEELPGEWRGPILDLEPWR